jgi:hypothetical protein
MTPYILRLVPVLVALLPLANRDPSMAAQVASSRPAASSQHAVSSRPAAASQPTVPIETLRALLKKTIETAETAEAANTLAGRGQALDQYRRAQLLLKRFPSLDTDPALKARIDEKVPQLQAQVNQALAARRAAEQRPPSKAAPPPDEEEPPLRWPIGGTGGQLH